MNRIDTPLLVVPRFGRRRTPVESNRRSRAPFNERVVSNHRNDGVDGDRGILVVPPTTSLATKPIKEETKEGSSPCCLDRRDASSKLPLTTTTTTTEEPEEDEATRLLRKVTSLNNYAAELRMEIDDVLRRRSSSRRSKNNHVAADDGGREGRRQRPRRLSRTLLLDFGDKLESVIDEEEDVEEDVSEEGLEPQRRRRRSRRLSRNLLLEFGDRSGSDEEEEEEEEVGQNEKDDGALAPQYFTSPSLTNASPDKSHLEQNATDPQKKYTATSSSYPRLTAVFGRLGDLWQKESSPETNTAETTTTQARLDAEKAKMATLQQSRDAEIQTIQNAISGHELDIALLEQTAETQDAQVSALRLEVDAVKHELAAEKKSAFTATRSAPKAQIKIDRLTNKNKMADEELRRMDRCFSEVKRHEDELFRQLRKARSELDRCNNEAFVTSCRQAVNNMSPSEVDGGERGKMFLPSMGSCVDDDEDGIEI